MEMVGDLRQLRMGMMDVSSWAGQGQVHAPVVSMKKKKSYIHQSSVFSFYPVFSKLFPSLHVRYICHMLFHTILSYMPHHYVLLFFFWTPPNTCHIIFVCLSEPSLTYATNDSQLLWPNTFNICCRADNIQFYFE